MNGGSVIAAIVLLTGDALLFDGEANAPVLQQTGGAEPSRMGKFLTALMNELRVLQVTTLYTLEIPNVAGPLTQSLGDLSSLGENLILLRFAEGGGRLHRLLSILKIRDSDFDPSLYTFVITDRGFMIEPSSTLIQQVIAGDSQRSDGLQKKARRLRKRRGD